jgi:ornithine cyclodeaminase/alanine dehydrogenase-like protein (mu-crystallin family)
MDAAGQKGAAMTARPGTPLKSTETCSITAEEYRVLRTSPEPCRSISDSEVHLHLTRNPVEYFRHMRDRLQSIAAGTMSVEMPPKQVFADPGGASDFRLMPCVTRANDRVFKSVKLVGTNMAQVAVPDQITVGKALVVDPLENYVTHSVDACLLSSARTGLCAALAVELLAARSRQLVIIGSGRVGYYAAYYAAAVCGSEDIVFVDRMTNRAEAAAAALGKRMPGIRCTAKSLNELQRTDVVVIATTSTTPVCAPPAWHASLVISLGADIDLQTELDPAWAQAADIYVDTMDTTRFGDLKAWLSQGLIKNADISDFSALLADGPIPTVANRHRLFVSTGSALFDNLTLEYLLQQDGTD